MSDIKLLHEVVHSATEVPLYKKIEVVFQLSLPAILAQISEIAMQYIDAAMVGSLGAEASASIGLVSTTTWLFGGCISATAAGFYVQIAHAIGGTKYERAKSILKQGLYISLGISLIIAIVGSGLAFVLPSWLGGAPEILKDAQDYFLVFALFAPFRMMFYFHNGALQATGNMKVPSILSSLMCILDILFNALFIFPSNTFWNLPGLNLGVLGAALGTAISYVVVSVLLIYFTDIRTEELNIFHGGSWKPDRAICNTAASIGLPIALEQVAMTSAQVYSTKIVAPLGTNAIAANSFAVTAESICYMPGYGIANAATTLVGQCIGAKNKDLAKGFAWLSTFLGMAVMTCMAILMFFVCPFVFAFLTPVTEVQQLGIEVLRIELFAEPLFAASICATGALRGAGDTLVPGIMNFVSIWGVRITLASILSRTIGLKGVWIGMACEISFRGILFLIRLARGKWLKKLEV